MKVFHGIDQIEGLHRPVITVGIFDGVHQGHRKILERLVRRAAHFNTDSLVMTFDPHPRQVLSKENQAMLFLNTMQERIKLLEAAGISALLIVPFTLEFASIEAEDFVRDIFVDKLNILHIISGYDHTFGKYGKGNFMLLEEMALQYQFTIEEIPAHDIDMAAVSSTRTREALKSGKVDLAARLLGYPYRIKGSVMQGQQIGSKIGFPTANIHAVDPAKIIPSEGVYAIKAEVNQQSYEGMMNIGTRPTLGTNEKSLEAHLFGCNEILYGKIIEIQFIQYIRAEQKFNSLHELSQQLAKDAFVAKLHLSKHETLS